MNPEPHNNSIYTGHEQRIFARMPLPTPESEGSREQRFQTTCQEIVDLYSMLQHKCIYGAQVNDLAHYPVIKVQTHDGEAYRNSLV